MRNFLILFFLQIAIFNCSFANADQLRVEHQMIFNENNPPVLQIFSEKPYEKIHWQLARDPDFLEIEKEEIVDFNASIAISSCSDNEGNSYFVRLKGKDIEGWDEWSEAAPFFFVHSINPEERPYERPESVSEDIWNLVKPYFLPLDHPAKPILDEITKGIRMTANYEQLKGAGFKLIRPTTRKKMSVVSHPKLCGYLVKTYLDIHNLFKSEALLWKRRIEGALLIQSTIDKHGYNHIFKVPKKWIYPLHLQAPGKRAANVYPKHFILLVEDMQVYDRPNNIARYKAKTTREILDALYRVVNEDKLFDSLFLDNIPWCKDGRIAFIDTEYFNAVKRTIKYKKLNEYLSPEMKRYWKKLIKRNGN